MAPQREGGIGCGAIIAIFLVIAVVVAAVISVAALVDPFNWVPPLGQIFGSCTDNPDTSVDECDLGKRYPGFWSHVLINFAYALVALALLVVFAFAVLDFRHARRVRFESEAAVDRYRQARRSFALVATLLGAVAALPIIAAVA
jgi:hypothetical protein